MANTFTLSLLYTTTLKKQKSRSHTRLWLCESILNEMLTEETGMGAELLLFEMQWPIGSFACYSAVIRFDRWGNKRLSQKAMWRTQDGRSKKGEKQDCKQKRGGVTE